MKFRAHCLGKIMTEAQSIDPALLDEETAAICRKVKKTDEDKAILAPLKARSLSAGAKTFIQDSAKELIYGYEKKVSSKYLDKGLLVESASIELYNSVHFTELTKNTERRENEWISGECDIATPRKIIDIKSSWSLDTFPVLSDSGRDSDYEWQGRAYMMLWDVPEFEIAYCLVNTPDELIGFEDPDLHYVEHINPALRVTTVQYRRDLALEELIKIKVEAARAYHATIIKRISAEHGG